MIPELKTITNIIINATNKTSKTLNVVKLSVMNISLITPELIATKPIIYQNQLLQNHYQNPYQLVLPKTFQDAMMPLKLLYHFVTKPLNLLMDHTTLNSTIVSNLKIAFVKLITALFVIANKSDYLI